MRAKCRYCGKVVEFRVVHVHDGDRVEYDAMRACPARLVQGCEPSPRDLARRKQLAAEWIK